MLRSLLFKVSLLCAPLVAIPMQASAAACDLVPAGLRCELAENPLGIDTPHPHLSWQLKATRNARNLKQTAYQIVVERLDVRNAATKVWDTGRVASPEQIQREYAGAALTSLESLQWKVRVWDGAGKASAWSQPSRWTMGILKPEAWTANWIGATPEQFVTGQPKAPEPSPDNPRNAAVLLRREFQVTQRPARASVVLCGLGYAVLTINGRRVDSAVLDPGFTDFSKRALYRCYEVGPLLHPGTNAIGVMLGGGWYNLGTPDLFGFEKAPWAASPRLKFMLRIEGQDGSAQTINSDNAWRWNTGEITYNSVRGGETIDHRAARPGWDRPGYNATGWHPVALLNAPAGRLVSQQHPPIRVRQAVTPVRITQPKPGVWLYDLGVNIAGWARFSARGAAGARITLQYNERLNPDGTLNTRNLSSHTYGRFQTEEFVLKGGATEIFEPQFTYHGFRYVQVTGLDYAPRLNDLTGYVVTTAPTSAGTFECSNPQLNRIQAVIRHTLLNNMHGIPTDCPQREKMGWMDDGCVDIEMACHNFDLSLFYRKWFHDMIDSQDANGHVPDIVPTSGWGKSRPDGSPGEMADPWWGGAVVMTPWKIYLHYGDLSILQEGYPAMKAYVDYMATTARDHIVCWGLGDWLDESAGGGGRRVPVAQTSTAAFAYFTDIVARTAALLGKPAEAATYRSRFEEIKQAFNTKFLNQATGAYAADSETAQAIPLLLGISPEEAKSKIASALVENCVNVRKNHISSGLIGTLYVFQALSAIGRDDICYSMVTQRDKPGWLYMLNNDATSLWEDWAGDNSLDHPALGCIGEWFYTGIAGIRLDNEAPGYRRSSVRPAVVGDLLWANCTQQTSYGQITSNWKRENGKITLAVVVPPNTSATVFVPTSDPGAVTESGKPVRAQKTIASDGVNPGSAVFQVGSGSYTFDAPLPMR